jgi:beta-phosphoglucomutase-like phosphatase (HAD superfamily)
MVAAVIFDLDGVLMDFESVWDDARRDVVQEANPRVSLRVACGSRQTAFRSA